MSSVKVGLAMGGSQESGKRKQFSIYANIALLNLQPLNILSAEWQLSWFKNTLLLLWWVVVAIYAV